MRKRIRLAALALAAMLPACAVAQVVGQTPDGDCIHRVETADGQALYYVASEGTEEKMIEEDVNFDGVPDLVALLGQGASNIRQMFFVRTEDGYVPALQQGEDADGVWNYSLDTERQLVVSDANNGLAGALRDKALYRWEGTTLALVRRAVSKDAAPEGPRGSTLIFSVMDADGDVLWTKTMQTENITADFFDEWDSALYSGM